MSLRRVLIVDDDESIRALLRMTLPSDAYEVAEARDGDEALGQLQARMPDLILLDWRMPGLGGSSVLDAVKAQHPELPVIVLTSELQQHHRVLAESLAVDSFLTKPFSPLELLATIERLLDKHPVDEPA